MRVRVSMQHTVLPASEPVASRRNPGHQCLITDLQPMRRQDDRFGEAADASLSIPGINLHVKSASQLPPRIPSGAFLPSLPLTVFSAALDKFPDLSFNRHKYKLPLTFPYFSDLHTILCHDQNTIIYR